jgi:hypothetical protein
MNTQLLQEIETATKIQGKIIDTTLIAKMIREQLKQEFPKCKFSVTSEWYSGGSSITVALMSAPFEAIVESDHWEKGYAQLNHYQLYRSFEEQSGGENHMMVISNEWRRLPDGVAVCNGAYITEKAWAVLQRAVQIGQAQNWDNSDSMTDYFDVNYYFHINIGKWNKPFTIK